VESPTSERFPEEEAMRNPRIIVTSLLLCAGFACAGLAAAQQPATVRVNVFPGMPNLAIYSAQAKGYFKNRALDLDLRFTPSSQAQREGLAKGSFDIAHAGVDNAVAMIEVAKADVAIVMGGDNGFNALYVQPGVRSFADFRGKTVVVDAPNTAYGLVLYKILQLNGVPKSDYKVLPAGAMATRMEAMRKDKDNVGVMLYPPITVLAEREGFKRLATAVDVIGRYQATGAFVMRPWAQANSDVLVRYIQAYVEGLRWALAPANKAEVVAIIGERLKLAPDVAALSYEDAMGLKGYTPDARFDIEGFRNTLKIRAEMEGQWGGNPPPPEKFLELSYYERALAGLQ
jgi:ABC-type nitrate/sulfonate/bicarbonate transport system substrate-binding protein